MKAALCLTVDVDGEAGLPDGGRGHDDRLTARSERRYGLVRGLPRLLDLFARHHARATFYVPGVTARRHPDEVRAIVDGGHEVAHHGHRHLPTLPLSPQDELAELRDGLAALEEVASVRPRGYRSPAWELTPVTMRGLPALGIAWDSSLMEDDRPYWLDVDGRALLELPVHWALDDAPHFEADVDPAALRAVWLRELRCAREEDRPLTVTVHPEIIGRAHRIDVLAALLDEAHAAGVPLLTHGDLLERERAARR